MPSFQGMIGLSKNYTWKLQGMSYAQSYFRWSWHRSMNDGCKGSPVELVLQMADQLRHHLELATRKVGITAPQAKLLVELADPRRMSDLAEHQRSEEHTSE